MAYIKFCLMVIAIFLTLAFLLWLRDGAPPAGAVRPAAGQPTPDIVKKMRYHGIDACECDDAGCWFYRNGKRCKL